MYKEDLKLPNHLMGHKRLYLQLVFRNVSDLLGVRRDIMPLALENSAKRDAVDVYAEVINSTSGFGHGTEDALAGVDIQFEDEGGDRRRVARGPGAGAGDKDPRECIIDIREYDVPYYLRVSIDNDLRVGLWYSITFPMNNPQQPSFAQIVERVKRADPVVLAYDIETTKAPLKFPDHELDQVMMISYMVDGQGYLITNREIVGDDIEDFEYTPKDGMEGMFTVFNEKDEASARSRSKVAVKPTVLATFNGDFFDFPFLDARARVHGISLYLETGFQKDSEDEYKSRGCVHMDCFRWVKRDSYLPQGSQGLKAVTTAKLGYNPIELDPELMTPLVLSTCIVSYPFLTFGLDRYATEQPQVLAQYSVSDAVATYYLYMKYVHPFIFSLCNIIPLCPDEVLRKGSGTLCETLLMVEAYRGGIIMPNRHEDAHGNMHEGHLLASETYVGGHVEALEAGVFRSDIPIDFKIVPAAVQQLIDDLDAALKFCITVESNTSLDLVTNYDEVKASVQTALEVMRDNPKRRARRVIGAWNGRGGGVLPRASRRVQHDQARVESRNVSPEAPGPAAEEVRGPERRRAVGPVAQAAGRLLTEGVQEDEETKVETREAIVCQRENPSMSIRCAGSEIAGMSTRGCTRRGRRTWIRLLARGSRCGGRRGEEDDRAVRLAAVGAQVHPQLVLRVRHAQGRALAFNGNGGYHLLDGGHDHPDGARIGRADWKAAGVRY
ncbi:DNA polymerase epsilon catalytic [Salix suchowensis]|nr:DNA polymerase epsilon catalytic [Salix suchowensis]